MRTKSPLPASKQICATNAYMKKKEHQDGCTCNGAITHAIIIAALLSLNGCKTHRAAEMGQKQTIIQDTVYIKQSDKTTQKDTFQRFLYLLRDTVKGGVSVIETIYKTSTTAHDTVYLKSTKQDTITCIQTAAGNNDKKSNKFLYPIIIIICTIFSVLCGIVVSKIRQN